MSRIFNILRSTGFLLVLTLIFYFAGMFCAKTPDIESLKQSGIATQEEYTYLDSEGEEHEGETLVEITGIGKILTYSDVYFAPIPLFLLAMLIGAFVLNNGDISNSDNLPHAVFANCIIGILLIWLTSKGTIISTILYWLGIITSYFAIKNKD